MTDAEAVKNIVEGAFSIFAVLGWIPGAIVAPVVLVAGSISKLFKKD
jgi:hypothetical protein